MFVIYIVYVCVYKWSSQGAWTPIARKENKKERKKESKNEKNEKERN